MPQLSKIRSDFSFYNRRKWIEYTGLCILAILIALITVKTSYRIGLLFAAISIGLTVLFLCFYKIEIGVYGMIVFGFLLAFIQRILTAELPLDTILLMCPFGLFAILLTQNMHGSKKWMVWHPIIFTFLVTVGYGLAQMFNPMMDSLLGWLSYFRGPMVFLCLLFLFLYLFKNIKNIRFFFKFIIIAIFITGLYGCIQQWFGFTSFESRWIHSRPGALQLFSLSGMGIRKFSFLSDPANFGILMASGALCTLILAFGPSKKIHKIILGFFTVFILLGMSYSGTRTANITFGAGLALYVLMTIYKKRTKILAACVFMLVLFIKYVPIYGNITLYRIRTSLTPTDDASYDLRGAHRQLMQPFMHSHPFGGGVNTTMAAGVKYNPHNFLAGFPPDSAYFAIALEQGWIGLALYCIFLFSLLFFAIHYYYKCKNNEIKTYYIAMAAILFSLMLGAYTQFTISSIPQNFIFAGFVAVIIKLHTFDTPGLIKTKP